VRVTEIERGEHGLIIARPPEPETVVYSDLDYAISPETAARLLTRQPENTRRAYDRNWQQFTQWYTVRLIGISLAPQTIEQCIWTIRAKHAEAGYKAQPDTKRTIELLRAYKHEWADAGGRTRKATPILIDALRAMVDTCDPSKPSGVRDRSLLLLGFNAMCRRSELSGLDIPDLHDAADEGVNLYIRYSKTDKDAEGAKVSIPFGQHAKTCAVRATRAWVEALSERGMTSGPLYRPVDRHGRIGDEPEASGRLSRRLSGKSVSDIVHRRALLAGLPKPEGYTGHSLRAGGATAAYVAGAPVSEIAKHGRWQENSPVVLGYIRAVDDWRNNPMKGVGL
jgi:integrase